MKRVKNYIEPELAKKKIARYKYWSIKDENSITIVSSDDNPEGKNFGDFLDKIIADNVDAEVQIKYGTNEQSSRQNPPFFIKVNQEIEWVEPEEEDTVSINGIAHKVDKNGNVNINLSTPEVQQPIVENANVDVFRQEMDMQLSGLRREYELKEEKWQMEMANKMMEQTLKFKEMMLAERESRIAEKEQILAQKEAEILNKESEINDDVKGYLKQVPSALGGVLKELIKPSKKDESLGEATEKKKPKERRKVKFNVQRENFEPNIEDEEEFYEDFEEEELTEDNPEIDQETETNNNLENTNKDEDLQD